APSSAFLPPTPTHRQPPPPPRRLQALRYDRRPPALRAIPTVPFWPTVQSTMRYESFDRREMKMVVPRLRVDDGIVLKFLHERWTVTIANPEYAKACLLRTVPDSSTLSPQALFSLPQSTQLPIHPSPTFTPDIFPKSPEFTTTDMLLNKFIGTRNILFQNGDVIHRAMPAKLFGALTLKMYDEFEKEANFVNVRDMFHSSPIRFSFPKALTDAHNPWHTTFNSIMHGITNPLFLFPVLEKPQLL
ncbi:hypothetical protein BC938DRAFT_478426, partial [Jimgerdemannia flammicorona]